MKNSELMVRLARFTKSSIAWCAAESEQAAGQVGSILDVILGDAQRVSHLSEEALAAVKTIREDLGRAASGSTQLPVSKLLSELDQLRKEHDEVSDLVFPIIQALQFQDRVRQNMENMAKIIDYWHAHRMAASQAGADGLVQYGEGLLKATTMVEERDTIRAHISGLSVEEVSDDVMLF